MGADGNQAGLHDLADGEIGESVGGVSDEVAQVAQRDNANRFISFDDHNSGNILLFHQSSHFDQTQLGRTGDGWPTADTVNGDKKEAVFIDSRHDFHLILTGSGHILS